MLYTINKQPTNTHTQQKILNLQPQAMRICIFPKNTDLKKPNKKKDETSSEGLYIL